MSHSFRSLDTDLGSRMLPQAAVVLLLGLLLAGCAGMPFGPKPEAADLVFYGENIYTVDESNADAEAVAVRGKEIVAVGTRREIARFEGDATRVVELGDHTLVPGFIDAHGHLGMAMQMLDLLNASSPPVGPMNSIDDIVEAIQATIKEQQISP